MFLFFLKRKIAETFYHKQLLPVQIIFSPELHLHFLKQIIIRPHGKESTEVRITQNKGKESENSYRKLKSSRWKGTRTHTETKSKYFDGRPSQSEEIKCMWAHDKDGVTRVFERCHQGVAIGRDGGKFKRRLSMIHNT